MAFYTIVPLEQLLAEDEPAQAVMMIQRGQVTMEVEPVSGSLGTVRRIYSSDPEDYLDARWQPGALVSIGLTDYQPKL